MTPDIAISDCRYWRYKGIPAYWYGPDSFLCSAANENVSIDEIFHIAATHALTAVKFLLPKNGKRTRREVLYYPPESTGFEAEIKSLPSQYIAYTLHVARSFSVKELTPIIDHDLEELYTILCAHDVNVGAVGMAIYEWKNNELSVITAYPVAPTVAAGDGYGVMELPEVSKAAVTVHRGSLKTCGRTWNAIAKWLKAQGKKATGQYREVYILGGHNPEPLWITELQLPLA